MGSFPTTKRHLFLVPEGYTLSAFYCRQAWPIVRITQHLKTKKCQQRPQLPGRRLCTAPSESCSPCSSQHGILWQADAAILMCSCQVKHGGRHPGRSSLWCQSSGRSDADIRRSNLDDSDLPSTSTKGDSESNGALALDANPVAQVEQASKATISAGHACCQVSA